MGLLAPTRRVYHRWRTVLAIYDGKACPDCGAIVCGREDRRTHRELHMQTEQWQQWVGDTLMQIARHVGIPTIDGERGAQAPAGNGDDYERVDLSVPDYDDDEEEE